MKFKIFLLNKSHDRETTGFASATDYIEAIVNACHDSLHASGIDYDPNEAWTKYVTHLVYLRECHIDVDMADLRRRGLECVGIWAGIDGVYEADVLERVLTGICLGRSGGKQRRATVQNWPIL